MGEGARLGSKAGLIWLAALAAVAAAALLAHEWGAQGFDPVFLILFLAILALAFDAVREGLAKVTNLKLPGGVEIALAVEDAVAEAGALPGSGEEEDRDESEDRRAPDGKLRILDADWPTDPAAALVQLRREMRTRLEWLAREFDGAGQRTLPLIEWLLEERLIKVYEARIARAVHECPGRALAREVDRAGDRGEAAVRFVERADKVVYQLRLIAFDAAIRKGLRERGLRIVDIEGQPSRRWPDFYVFDPAPGSRRPPLRIAVRVARNRKSELIRKARARLSGKTKETPFDELVEPAIVYPQTSNAKPDQDDEVPARKREAFFAWIDDGWGAAA